MTHHDLNETDLEDKIEQTPVFAECKYVYTDASENKTNQSKAF